MKNKNSVFIVLLILVGVIFIACSPNEEEIVASIDQYRDTLNNLFTELEEKFNENPSAEDWQNFSQDWMTRLTAAKPDELNENVPEGYMDRVNGLDYTKSQLIYLWNEYNNKITKNSMDQSKVQDFKEVIEKNLE